MKHQAIKIILVIATVVFCISSSVVLGQEVDEVNADVKGDEKELSKHAIEILQDSALAITQSYKEFSKEITKEYPEFNFRYNNNLTDKIRSLNSLNSMVEFKDDYLMQFDNYVDSLDDSAVVKRIISDMTSADYSAQLDELDSDLLLIEGIGRSHSSAFNVYKEWFGFYKNDLENRTSIYRLQLAKITALKKIQFYLETADVFGHDINAILTDLREARSDFEFLEFEEIYKTFLLSQD